jgi:hypothetical protein
MGKKPQLVLMLTVAGASFAMSSHADPSAADRTLAAALFREAKSLIGKGDYVAACTKLEESERLDPGGGTLLNLALCHEKQGKLATAWGEFIEALGIARRDDRQARIDLAEEHIAKLEPLLSKMTIVVPPESDEPSLEITRDGAVVGRAAWGMPFPVDPGGHQVQAVAANKVPFRSSVNVDSSSPASTLTVRIPSLQRDADVGAPGAAAAGVGLPSAGERPAPLLGPTAVGVAAGAGRPVSAPPGEPGPGPSSAQRTWGWGAIGLGGAGVIAGTALTVVALGKKSDSHDRCPRDPCDAEAVSLSQDAGRFADFATVGFGVGFAALAAGVILLVTDGPSTSRAGAANRTWVVYPQAGPGEAAMAVRSQF